MAPAGFAEDEELVSSDIVMTETPKPRFPSFPLRRLAHRRAVLPFERGARPRDHIYASELGKCPRAVWFNWHYPDARDGDFSEKRGALGHAVEEAFARQIAALTVSREVSFYDEEHHLSGRVDFVVRLSHAGPMIPVELKSTYAYSRFVADPMEPHLMQLRYYLTQMPEAPFGLLVYYNLSNWGGAAGEWTSLRIDRRDRAVHGEANSLWEVVHRARPPDCEEKDCFDCSVSPEAALKSAVARLEKP